MAMLDKANDARPAYTDDSDMEQLPSAMGSSRSLRKLIHLALSVVPVIAWFLSYELALALACVLLAASLALEAARRWWPWVNCLLWRLIYRPQLRLDTPWATFGIQSALWITNLHSYGEIGECLHHLLDRTVILLQTPAFPPGGTFGQASVLAFNVAADARPTGTSFRV